ncbi:Ldh family oxidoreductase [Natrialbaceae archaeon A-CW1-1]
MRFEEATLERVTSEFLGAMGTPRSSAEMVAASLVRTDARTEGTHGVGLLPLYAEMIADGAIDPEGTPTLKRTGAVVQIDGNRGFGQLAGRKAAAAGVEAAFEHGAAVVTVHDASHLGRLGEIAERTTDAGCCALALSNTGGGAKNVAAHGGTQRTLSTNPVAFGIPTFDALEFDIIVDFATSQVSGSVIREAARAGRELDPAWTTSDDGTPVEDGAAFLAGEGSLLPLGGRDTGHKGYGLAVVAEALGALAGAPVVGESEPVWFANAATVVVIDPAQVGSPDLFERRLERMATHIRSSGKNVRLPGEGAYRRAVRSEKRGIPIADHVRRSLGTLAADVDVELPAEFTVEDDPKGSGDVRTW